MPVDHKQFFPYEKCSNINVHLVFLQTQTISNLSSQFPLWSITWYLKLCMVSFHQTITYLLVSWCQILASEPIKLSLKLRVFYSSYWHLNEALAILFFLIGMGFRSASTTKSAGRVIYCCVIIMWYLKVLEILSVNIYLGPFVNMIGKMVSFLFLFCVVPPKKGVWVLFVGHKTHCPQISIKLTRFEDNGCRMYAVHCVWVKRK